MLPLVRRIVADVRARERLMRLKRRRVEAAGSEGGETREDRDMGVLGEAQERLTRELEELGCFLRDPERGVVECFGELEGEIVYFTWRPGGEAFSLWHPLDTSPASARPMPPAAESRALAEG